MNQPFRAPRYRLREDHRQTVRGIEKIILEGSVVEPIQEIIHYQKRSHRVQVRYTDPKTGVETIAWVAYKKLSTLPQAEKRAVRSMSLRRPTRSSF